MARTHDRLDDNLISWIGEQHVFFVATAPSGDDGHVNLSPKGYDTFRVLGPTSVAYLDLTGSGVETIAHLRQNGRLTVMFCAFEGPPRILRLFGRGSVVLADEPGFTEAAAPFGTHTGARSVIRCDIDRIQSSCGYAVPFMSYESERETLAEWADRKGRDGVEAYWGEKNTASIDGIAGIPAGASTSGAAAGDDAAGGGSNAASPVEPSGAPAGGAP